jgi:hypothetical protein
MTLITTNDLLSFFEEIMQGNGIVNGDGISFPTLEQRIKAAHTLLGALEKQPQKNKDNIHLEITPEELEHMKTALRKRWEQSISSQKPADNQTTTRKKRRHRNRHKRTENTGQTINN